MFYVSPKLAMAAVAYTERFEAIGWYNFLYAAKHYFCFIFEYFGYFRLF